MTRSGFIKGGALALAAAMLTMSAVAETEPTALAARTRRGVLVLQVGSDWCVSGEHVRKAFESWEFEKVVGGKYVLAVYDEMESPTEAVKAKNALVKDILIRTKRFPALTCYAPGKPPRVFAQIENIPGNVTPEKLARAVSRVTERKDGVCAAGVAVALRGQPRTRIVQHGQHGRAAAASRQVRQPSVSGVRWNVLDGPLPAP